MFDVVKIRDGRDNFFTPLRLVFALIILLGHAYHVADGGAYANVALAEPKVFLNYELSYLVVNMFFIISGFLLTKSLLQSKNLVDYAAGRLLRLFPALAVLVLFVMFIVGPFVTQLQMGDFFAHPEFYSQPLKVLSLYDTQMILPGAFTGNVEQLAGQPLWTLGFLGLAYIGTAIVFSLGLFEHKWTVLAPFIACMALWFATNFIDIFDTMSPTFQIILRFALCYSLGAAVYVYREKLTFHILGIPLIGLVAVLFRDTDLLEITLNIWFAYIIFWAAYVNVPKLNKLQKMGDISYGVYIYHFCVLQCIYYIHPHITTLELFTLALPVTLLLAYLSWRFVEKPALLKREKITNILKFKFSPRSSSTLTAE